MRNFTKLLLSAAAIIFTISGCNKNTKIQLPDEALSLEITETSEQINQTTQLWHLTNKRILVLFGYNFNTPETVTQIKTLLQQKYGLDQDGGLILPLIYPDDFKHGSKSLVSELTSVIQSDNYDFSGIILLGAPENTHKALAIIQDSWEMNMQYPIVALFPQDDVLGIESTCDFVLDKGAKSPAGEMDNEETEVQIYTETPELLISIIDYIKALKTPPAKDKDLQTHFLQMLKNRKIRHYADPETGLVAINHYVLE